MNDLVRRLRGHVSPSWGSAGDAMREAADEIEALRELLRQVRAERDELAVSHYAAVAAERERWCALLQAVRDANAATDGDTFRLPTHRQDRAWQALLDAMRANVEAKWAPAPGLDGA